MLVCGNLHYLACVQFNPYFLGGKQQWTVRLHSWFHSFARSPTPPFSCHKFNFKQPIEQSKEEILISACEALPYFSLQWPIVPLPLEGKRLSSSEGAWIAKDTSLRSHNHQQNSKQSSERTANFQQSSQVVIYFTFDSTGWLLLVDLNCAEFEVGFIFFGFSKASIISWCTAMFFLQSVVAVSKSLSSPISCRSLSVSSFTIWIVVFRLGLVLSVLFAAFLLESSLQHSVLVEGSSVTEPPGVRLREGIHPITSSLIHSSI